MLHKDPFILSPAPFNLIRELQALPGLSSFMLAGSTSLALQQGYRHSTGINLFTREEFSTTSLINSLSRNFEFEVRLERKNRVLTIINNVKTDFIRHDYPLLQPPIHEEGIRLLGLRDIAAMKVHAIIQSGKRLKDFIDIHFLLTQFSLKDILGFFTAKYTYSNEMIALKALTYFDDIDVSIDPPKTRQPLPLSSIRHRIGQAALHPKRIF